MKDLPVIGKDPLGRTIKDFTVMPWWGIDRKDIEWYPTIDYDACTGCGICFITCGNRIVFDWDKDMKKPVVARPYNCVVSCSTCGNLCPHNALTFPDKEYMQEIIIKEKILKKAADKLKEHDLI